MARPPTSSCEAETLREGTGMQTGSGRIGDWTLQLPVGRCGDKAEGSWSPRLM